MIIDDYLYDEEFNNDYNTEKKIFKENSSINDLNLNVAKKSNPKIKCK